DLNELINSSNQGRILKDGIKTAIIGKPNVGKSSLLNALLKENRAIVTDVAGTTRDTIEESLNLGGVSINIIDTAGIRDTDDLVESIGVEKSIQIANSADLVIAIFDMSRLLDNEDEKILELLNNKKSIILL
ncbi:GTP-binding protein, partial [Bacteroides pyogenes]